MQITFHPDKFLGGTKSFTYVQRGMYITALCYQALNGFIAENKLLAIAESEYDIIVKKFIKDEHGNYFNKRMRQEMIDSVKMKERDEMRKKVKHSFEDSEIYSKPVFKGCFPSWSKEKLLHYYERAKEWSLNKEGMSKDWQLTINGWARTDEQKGIVKFKSIRLTHSEKIYGN